MNSCKNCGAELSDGGVFKNSNKLLDSKKVARINLAYEAAYEELCERCGGEWLANAATKLEERRRHLLGQLEEISAYYPMFTVDVLPPGANYVLKGLVTANVTVGTGLVNEVSQGVTDFLGIAATNSGMAHKANKGELAARMLLISKAMDLKANAIVGVDIDYGVTATNSATVNMQGTAVHVRNLTDCIQIDDRALLLDELVARIRLLDESSSVLSS